MTISVMQPISTRIRALRASFGLTQAEAGARLGVSSTTIRRWELGRGKGPTMPQLYRIALFYNVDPFWLFSGKGKQR